MMLVVTSKAEADIISYREPFFFSVRTMYRDCRSAFARKRERCGRSASGRGAAPPRNGSAPPARASNVLY